MSLEKTTKESFRNFTDQEKYPVYEALPAYFETQYPVLTAFLEKYYRHEGDTGVLRYVNDLEHKRDFVEASDDLLRFLSKELLLGRDYFDRFIDKQTAVQTSNLLYRSKGTKYSIQQFFRVFFGFDTSVRYGRDEVFVTGDPAIETLVYQSKIQNGSLFPGKNLRFVFDDGDIQVWAVAKDPVERIIPALYYKTDTGEEPYTTPEGDTDGYVKETRSEFDYDIYHQLRQDVDYTIQYADKLISLQPTADGYESVYDDPWINQLSRTGVMPEGQKVKIVVKRDPPAGSFIGSDMSEKKITNNGFYQLFSLAIKTPISIKQWRQSYKDFIHPAGMYLEGEVAVESTDKLFKKNPVVSLEQYRKPSHAMDTIDIEPDISVTELNVLPWEETLRTYSLSGYVTNDRTPFDDPDPDGFDSAGAPTYSEERLDSDQPDTVYRSRLNDIKRLSARGITMEELDTQYQRMVPIDDIEARTLDTIEADLSNTINTIDENKWYGAKTDGYGNNILGDYLDFPPEYPGIPGYIFRVDRKTLKGYASTGFNEHIVTGEAEQKITAYRDIRVWGNTYAEVDYTTPIPSATPSSVWQGDEDYVNIFDRSRVVGQASAGNLYFVFGFIEDRGAPGPGDPEDYMADSSI